MSSSRLNNFFEYNRPGAFPFEEEGAVSEAEKHLSHGSNYDLSPPKGAAKTGETAKPVISHSNSSDQPSPKPIQEHSITPGTSLLKNTESFVGRTSAIFEANISQANKKASLSPKDSLTVPTPQRGSSLVSSHLAQLQEVHTQSASTQAARKRSLHAVIEGQDLITVIDGKNVHTRTESKVVHVVAKEASKAKIPDINVGKLINWLKNNEDILAKDSTRKSYTTADIPNAINAYKAACQCGWREMKHLWGSNPEMKQNLQIINDLRRMVIDERIADVKQKFPGLEVLNAGSADLTSDCDLSLRMPNDRGKEIEAVAYYREGFKQGGWGASSAYIFDNNAYTSFYLEKLNTFDKQVEQQDHQTTMSLVMFARTAGSENWQTLKGAILSETAAKDLPAAERQFLIVDTIVQELTLTHSNATLKAGLEEKNTEQFHGSADLTAGVKATNPDLIVSVDESLEVVFKDAVKQTIASRTQLNGNLEKMAKTEDPNEKIALYQNSIEVISRFIDDQIGRLTQQKNDLQHQAMKVGLTNPRLAIPLREQSTRINQQMVQLGELKKNLNVDSASDPRFIDSITQWSKSQTILGGLQQKLNLLNDSLLKMQLLSEQKEKLEAAFKKGGDKATLESNQIKLSEVEKSMTDLALNLIDREGQTQELKQRIEEEKEHLENTMRGGDLLKLNALLEMSDEMQLTIEHNSMKAQCFAQEAHVASTTIGFVVNDIQMGEANVRNIGSYMQATLELMGFYHAHQAHLHTPHQKMIEVSKYVGPRLIEAYSRMETQAKALGISFPVIEKKQEIQKFFNELLVLRKSADLTSAEKMSKAIESAKKYQMPMTKAGLIDNQAIDTMMVKIQGKMFAWMSSLTPEQRLGIT